MMLKLIFLVVNLVRPALFSAMLEHNTCQATTERLKEVVNCLRQGQTYFTQNHDSLSQA